MRLPVHVHLVLLAVDGHGADAQLCAGPENSDGNLSAVGHQHTADGAVLHSRTCCLQVLKVVSNQLL